MTWKKQTKKNETVNNNKLYVYCMHYIIWILGLFQFYFGQKLTKSANIQGLSLFLTLGCPRAWTIYVSQLETIMHCKNHLVFFYFLLLNIYCVNYMKLSASQFLTKSLTEYGWFTITGQLFHQSLNPKAIKARSQCSMQTSFRRK